MKKNVVTIIFLFLIIFVTLMFGQEFEGFALIDQTDPDGPSNQNNGTYFTRKDGIDNIFSKFKEMYQSIRNRYGNAIDACLNAKVTSNDGSLRDKTDIEKAECQIRHNLDEQDSRVNLNKITQMATLATNGPLSGLKTTKTQHDATKATISATNETNKATRQELDQKMSEMLNDETGMKLESETKRNAAVYTSIVGTVLAATVLYYIFLNF